MNSIKLSYEEYMDYQNEKHPFYCNEEGRPITLKIRRAGVNPDGMYIMDTGNGVVLSNEPIDKGPKEIVINLTPEQKEEFNRAVLKDIERNPFILTEPGSIEIIEPEVNKTEALNIFNELLKEWYDSEECIIHERSVTITSDRIALAGREEEYKQRFMKAMGVE